MFVKMETNFSDGKKGWICLRIIFSGCKRAVSGNSCKHCHNPHLWNFDYTESFDAERQLREWKESGAEFDAVSIIGGEPLDQPRKDLELYLSLVHRFYPDLPVIVYTGYEKSKVFSEFGWIRDFADYIKTGEYREDIPSEDTGDGPELASGNQKFERIKRL